MKKYVVPGYLSMLVLLSLLSFSIARSMGYKQGEVTGMSRELVTERLTAAEWVASRRSLKPEWSYKRVHDVQSETRLKGIFFVKDMDTLSTLYYFYK